MEIRPIPPDRQEWLSLRRGYIGASEVAILFGAQPDYMPGIFALWHVKAGIVPAEDVSNERTAWGLALEDAIAAYAGAQEGWQVEPGVYASAGRLGATLDRLIAAPGPNDEGCNGPGVLELKNVDWLVHKRQWGDEPPLHILLQLQAQLLASGRPWGAVASLVGGNDLHVYRFHARAKIQAEIARRVAEFWLSVDEGRPPAADGSDATYRALMALNPEAEEEPADLEGDNEAIAAAADLLKWGAAEREAKKKRDAARNTLLAKLGPHRWGKAGEFRISQAIVEAKPARAAELGEIISGRAESRRITVKEAT